MWSETRRLTTRAAVKSLRGSSFWIIAFGVIVVCFLSGPFGTFEALPNGFRLIYWTLIVLSTGLLSLWASALIRTQKWIAISRIALVGVVFGLVVSGLVILLSLLLLPPIRRYPGHIELLMYSFPSATVIFVLSVFLSLSISKADEGKKKVRPALFDRLKKYPKAKKLLSLSAQDHYVEITTELGSELCLIRLNDAISEAAPEEGSQVHRSHWVAKSAIEELEIKGSRGLVRLVDGRTLNVSQSRLADFRAFCE